MSDLVVDVGADPRWVPLSLDGDVDAESAATAREVWRVRGVDSPDQDAVEQVAALLAGLARQTRESADAGLPLVASFALVPEEEPLPLAVATLLVTDGEETLDQAVEALIAPAEERYGDPLIEQVETSAGTATRVAQQLVDAERQVGAWIGYVWPLDGTRQLLVLSTTFVDLVEAGRWEAAFHDLALQVHARVEPA